MLLKSGSRAVCKYYLWVVRVRLMSVVRLSVITQ